MTPILETRGLSKSFGGFFAAADVNLAIEPGIRQALIGPNGAGKTTLVNLLTGTLPASAGTVFLHGQDITRLPPQARVRLGLSRTFQINQLFPDLTPLQAVVLAINEREGRSHRFWRAVDAGREVVHEAMNRLHEFGLDTVARERTADLPYGRQRLLELVLALAARPRVLLLDEPAAGIPSGESGEILDAIGRLPRDVTILLIEHDMDLVFRFAERITVLVNGRVLVEGAPDAIARDPEVRAVYLGEEAHV
ncbi:MAG: ABC transporter ATP-binding protein [Rhodospirillales bacterium]|nr:ABC transporter ATP-binding protein [Rhodospirillales bacterium]